MTHRAHLALAISLALLALGCEARVSLGGRCANDGDCPGTLVCRFDRCRSQCESANDCRDPGAICIGEPGRGVCSVPSVDTCTNDCADGLVCAGETCAVPCMPGGDDCLTGSTCSTVSGMDVCVAVPAADAGAPDAHEETDSALDAGPPPPPPPHRGLCVGLTHACAIRDGNVFCWGENNAGQLGDSPDDLASVPHLDCGPTLGDCAPAPTSAVRVPGGAALAGVVEIACGEAFTCALSAGTVSCWGTTGASTIGRPEGGHAAVAMPGITGATALVTGRHHACARLATGWTCWGQNRVSEGHAIDDRLGSGDTVLPLADSPVPAPSFADAPSLAGGGYFTCAIHADGVRCQGFSEAGVIGDVTSMLAIPTPTLIAGTMGASEVVAGVLHACALIDGRVSCWGGNQHGQLGSSGGSPCVGLMSSPCRGAATPVTDSSGDDFSRLSMGYAVTTCAIVGADGSVRCWGDSSFGQGGVDGGTLEAPSSAIPGVSRAIDVAVGGETVCARNDAEQVWCWGRSDYGQLGCGTHDTDRHPAACQVMFP